MTRTGSVSSPRWARCSRVHLDTVLVAQVSQPAVSPTSSRQARRNVGNMGGRSRPADWKSAIQPTGSLRYKNDFNAPGVRQNRLAGERVFKAKNRLLCRQSEERRVG